MERERERERGLLTVGNEKRFAENRRGMKILWDDECWFSVAKTLSPMAGRFSSVSISLRDFRLKTQVDKPEDCYHN
ncbi:unnamed protein product [Brassica oleracea]|uniref:(rape) hypothetical protein n=1 Tax=Brassica napus TaxID=3708 RepID=A0A816JGW8_BRANA|nr:unnamed protein product [Brassica napus]